MSKFIEDRFFEVGNVAEYLQAIQKLEHQQVAQWFFRGHSDFSFKLVPTLFRLDITDTFASWERVEQYMMEIFMSESRPHLKVCPETGTGWSDPDPHHRLEWLALAQHHKLPTRLLDWSMNPLVALYFAVECSACDGDVWCFGLPAVNNCYPDCSYMARRMGLKDINAIYFPNHIAPRITAQSGCFTVHDDVTPFNEVQEAHARFFAFARIRVPQAKKITILNDLFGLGIHQAFIFPDLDGISQRIKYEVTATNYGNTYFTQEMMEGK